MQQLRTTPLGDTLTLQYFANDTAVGGKLAKFCQYEPYETAVLLSFIDEGDLAIDVGANIGIYTLLFADKIGSEGTVYAFEPEPKNFQLLEDNIQENDLTNIKAYPVALSDKKGRTELFLSRTNLGDHRLFPEDGKQRKSIEIQTDTLDHILLSQDHEKRPVQVIKIDTQGYEPFVINGAKKIIARDHPAIVLEYWPFGYRLSGGKSDAMLDYLLSVYSSMAFIDEKAKKLVRASPTL